MTNLSAIIPPSRHHEFMGGEELCMTLDECNVQFFQLTGSRLSQLRNDCIFPPDDLWEIDTTLNSQSRMTMIRVMVTITDTEKILARHASHIDAGAPDRSLFNHRHRRFELTCLEGCGESGRLRSRG